jgi:tetratricopeptide (TPR) repeat protein
MERFFETGEGHPYDASVHLYSMTLCNLAVVHQRQGRALEAIELARRGIAVDPLIEHYDVIFSCQVRLKDHAGIVKAAEDFWNFSTESDYTRFDPEECARFSAESLSLLGRAREIPIWLERLTQWERQNDVEENDLPENHLYARLVVLAYMSDVDGYKETVLDAWRRIEAQVRENETGKFDDFAGDLTRSLEFWEDALFFYERSEAFKGTSETREEFKALCRAGIADQKNAGKRWWQVWK